MNLLIFVSVLLVLFGTVAWSLPTPYPMIDKGSNSKTSHPQIGEDVGWTLACKCGKFGTEWKKRIDRDVAIGIFNHMFNSNVDVSSLAYYPATIGKMMKLCKHCEILYTTCDPNPEIKNGSQCKQISMDMDQLQYVLNRDYGCLVNLIKDNVTSLFSAKVKRDLTKRQLPMPHHVHIPIGGLKERSKRQLGTCLYPRSLQTSELDCVHYPKYVRCIQKCAVGHTLKDGSVVENICHHKLDRWENGDFRECKPFVDCTLTLMSGGTASCSAPTLHEGPKCQIRCDEYEDKDSIIVDSSCNIEGHWRPALPYCAYPGSGLKLVDKNGNPVDDSMEYEVPKKDDQPEKYDEDDELGKQDENEFSEEDYESYEKQKDSKIPKVEESRKVDKYKDNKIPAKESGRKEEGKQKEGHKEKGTGQNTKATEIKTEELDDLDYYDDYEDSGEED